MFGRDPVPDTDEPGPSALVRRVTKQLHHTAYNVCNMSTSIRLSNETKSMLAVLKADDESWDEFLARLARRERDVAELSGFADSEGIVEHMEEADTDLSESIDENVSETDDLLR